MAQNNFKIILSRTDSIGDVVLTLPMAGFLKKHFPGCTVIFLGRDYTRDVVALSAHVDEFVSYDEVKKLKVSDQVEILKKISAEIIVHVFPRKEIATLAKKAGIPARVGTTNRIYHWLTCNRLIKLSRKRSALHEAQLNIKLLGFLDVNTDAGLDEFPGFYGFSRVPQLNDEFLSLIDPQRFNLILHPTSKGSAKEWGIDNYESLVAKLPESRYKIFITGTKDDGKLLADFILRNKKVHDLTGKLSLEELVAFIDSCNGLVAASTGPLHLAAALGKKSIGLFSPKKPIHPGRWMPLGIDAHAITFDENCETCARKKDCDCITRIKPQQVIDLLET